MSGQQFFVILANPRGFCAGVDRAIEIVERALERFGPPIYVRHEVVHNRFVVENLRRQGAVFVDELAQVPTGSTVVFSAHGVSMAVRDEAEARGLHVFDATCPLVTKVHTEVARLHAAGQEIVMIGHRGHPEVEGTLGQAPDRIYLVETPKDVENLQVSHPERLAYVTQTTLSVDDAQRVIDALRLRYPAIQGPRKDDICYATQNRQDAVKVLTRSADLVIVVGSPPVPIRIVCAKWRSIAASRLIWWTAPMIWIRPGWWGNTAWESPPGPPLLPFWFRKWSPV